MAYEAGLDEGKVASEISAILKPENIEGPEDFVSTVTESNFISELAGEICNKITTESDIESDAEDLIMDYIRDECSDIIGVDKFAREVAQDIKEKLNEIAKED